MWSYQQYPHPDDIIHFGVKGMKWGVRRERKESSSDSKTSESTRSSKPAKLSRPKTTPYHSWTEEERTKFDSEYARKRAKLVKAFKHAKDPKVKARIMTEADDLETEYLDVHEDD